jgi:hypothetical protein
MGCKTAAVKLNAYKNEIDITQTFLQNIKTNRHSQINGAPMRVQHIHMILSVA